MKYTRTIMKFLTLLLLLFSPCLFALAQQETSPVYEAADFDELKATLSQIQSVGGTIRLTDDILIPEEENYTFINGRYQKEITIETGGHTVFVQGTLTLWPYLTICGDHTEQELFHVSPGGELHLVSICIDAGESGTAVVQEEGSFFTYGSNEGLPEFSCIGRIAQAPTITAAAYWKYNCEQLPLIRVPEGTDFSADMLPETVLALVNRNHGQSEEEVPVEWNEASFPDGHIRTLVTGSFPEEYSQYKDSAPQCLIVWESDTSPFFLHAYMETTMSYDIVYVYAETPLDGNIYLLSSDDGEQWNEITGTDGYEPLLTNTTDELSWILFYPNSEPVMEHPRYYRMLQVLDDGTERYSDILELNDSCFFTGSSIEGGRGGETSPNEGENQLPDIETEPESPSTLSEDEPTSSFEENSSSLSSAAAPSSSDAETNLSSASGNTVLSDKEETGSSDEETSGLQPDQSRQNSSAVRSDTDTSLSSAIHSKQYQTAAGIGAIVCILAGFIFISVRQRKKH